MRIINFISFLVILNMGSLLSQSESIKKEGLSIGNNERTSQIKRLSSEKTLNRFEACRLIDSLFIESDSCSSFWSMDVGILNYYESRFPPSVVGFSLGTCIENNWYATVKFHHCFDNERNLNGNELIFLIGKKYEWNNFGIILNAGTCVFLYNKHHALAYVSEIDFSYQISKRLFLSTGFRWSLYDAENIIIPSRNSAFLLGVNMEF